MGFEITDGTGKGNKVAVNNNNRLLVRSVSEDTFQRSAELGDAFFAGAPITNISVATEVAVLHIKSNEDQPLVLGNFLFMSEDSSVGAGAYYTVKWYKNSGGMSNGTAFTPLNQNFGSSKTLDGTFEYGNGSTSTISGTFVAALSFPTGVFQNFGANLVLEKGSEVVFTVQAPATNTSMNFYLGTRLIRYNEGV